VGSLDWTGCPDHPLGEVYAEYTALPVLVIAAWPLPGSPGRRSIQMTS